LLSRDPYDAEILIPRRPLGSSVTASVETPNTAEALTIFVLVVVILYFGKEVLVPVVLALLLAFLLAPIVRLLRRAYLGPVPSVLLGVLTALGIIFAIGTLIGTQVAQLTPNLPKYFEAIEKKVDYLQAATIGRISELANELHQGELPAKPSEQQNGNQRGTAPAAGATPTAKIAPLDLARQYLFPVLSPLATLGVVFIITIFALLQQEELRDRLIRFLGSDDLHKTTIAIDDGGRRLRRYFITQLCLNTAFGVVVGIGLRAIGVPNPVLFGVLSALLRFVPYVGSPLSAILPMAMAAAIDPGWSMLLWTLGLYVVVEVFTSQIVEPLLYGHSTGLSPFSVIVAAIFWSWVWGPIGLILSTPLTLCLVVLGRHVKRLEFLEVMLGDRPALSPAERFYQRILSGDADEAQDQAEQFLKERSLSDYYDEIAIKGLQLAASDARRGVLNVDQLDRISITFRELVSELDAYDYNPQVDPVSAAEAATSSDDKSATPERLPPRDASQPILCITGRNPLDEAAAGMLVQLLGKHNMSSRLVPYAAVSRGNIQELGTEHAKMACIFYLDISGNPPHLRYLLQRLRRRLPSGAPILVGLWPANDSALRDPEIRAQVGADYFVCTLAEAVSACATRASEHQEATPQVA
jgi:predicted PurR-regulated permease PerM